MGSNPTGPITSVLGSVVPTNIAVIRSLDKDVRDAVKHIMDSLGLFWEEVDEPDPLRHSIAVFPEATDFVPVPVPSIFVGQSALSYYGGDRTEVKKSPPEPSGFMVVDKVKIPYFGTKYELQGERISRQVPLYGRDSHLLLGYDLFRNVSYFLRGAESSLKLKGVRTSDRKFIPRALEDLRGVPISIPIVDLHAKFLLLMILLLHKREKLPLITKHIPPPGYKAGISVSIPLLKIGRPSKFNIMGLFRKSESLVERLIKANEELTFFVGKGEDYTPSKIRKILISMEERGHEVGLLASVRASLDHMTMAEEYREVAEILKRGNMGVRFRGIASTLMDAWKSAAYVEAGYVLAGELAEGFGFPLGIGCPFRPDGLVWNVPLIGKVSDRNSANKAVGFASKWGCMVAVDAIDEIAILSLIRSAMERDVWVAPLNSLIERYKAISSIKGAFVYDRRYLEGKLIPQGGASLQLNVINPEGKKKVVKVDLENGKPQEIRISV